MPGEYFAQEWNELALLRLRECWGCLAINQRKRKRRYRRHLEPWLSRSAVRVKFVNQLRNGGPRSNFITRSIGSCKYYLSNSDIVQVLVLVEHHCPASETQAKHLSHDSHSAFGELGSDFAHDRAL